MKKIIILGNIKDVKENYRRFIDDFVDKLMKINKYKCEVIVAGDYNIDLL